MTLIIEFINGPLLVLVTYFVSVLTLWMVFRASWLLYILTRDYKEQSSRSFLYFFLGITLASLRALVVIPFTEPVLWSLSWQAAAYFFIVFGLEKIYEEIKNDH